MNGVAEFISGFHRHESVTEVFTEDQSYWFAVILFMKYIKFGAQIVCKEHKYAVRIGDGLWNISGRIKDDGLWNPISYK